MTEKEVIITRSFARIIIMEATDFEPGVLIKHIDTFGRGLTAWEVKFISDLVDNPPPRYSKKQVAVINRLYDERC